MDNYQNYIYRSEVNWSILTEGLTLPVDNQVVFARNLGGFLHRGECKEINLLLNNKVFKAQIRNVDFDMKFNRKKDTLQIRYPKNGNFARELQTIFKKSYAYILATRVQRSVNDRSMILLPEECKEYLAIYTTEYEDTYIFETIQAEDIEELRSMVKNQPERIIEADLNYDDKASIYNNERVVKIRKLNRKISDNLKLLYDYHCQICGQRIGDDYDANIIEAHHIDYFVKSLNNNSDNQIIVCPNHHSIIHAVNPIFNRAKLNYQYPNG